MKRMAWSIVMGIVLSFTPPQGTLAADDEMESNEDLEVPENLSLQDLLTMEITTGSFLELDISQSPLSMTVITGDMIHSSGARHMSELLDIYVPGFIYNYNKWNGTQWALRGVANDRNTKIVYLVNGHKMNTQTRDGFQSEIVLGMLGDVDRVEVLRGPAGLVYGTGAIAGIINVVTKKAEGNTSSARVTGATDGNREIEANIYGKPGDDQQFSASVGYRQSNGFPYDKVRVYGTSGWPAAPGFRLGAPTEGRFGSTPGNWKVATDWTRKNTNIYFRATRQNEATTAFFIRDPWPQISGVPDSTAPGVIIDGKRVTGKDPYWKNTENWWEARKNFRTDNIVLEGSHELQFGDNHLKMKLSLDRNQSQTLEDRLLKYLPENDYLNGRVFETFGEARYTANATYLLKSVKKLQAAMGMEYYLDDLGPDFSGKNEKAGNPKHFVIPDITYHSFSLFGEGFYDITDVWGAHGGFRLDIHSRAIMINPKVALISRPWKDHSFKLIYQSASNNGSADNYEYNRYHVSDNGTIITEPVLQDENADPNYYKRQMPLVQPAPPLSVMHDLKPEKVHSVEATYAGRFLDAITVEPSFAWGQIVDLFGWSDKLFRVVNVGQYQYINADIDLKYSSKMVTFGVNHTWQRPVNTNPDKEKKTYYMYQNIYDTTNGRQGWGEKTGVDINGDTTYKAYYSQSAPVDLNVVKTSITYDGRHFMSIPDHMTKMYLSYSPAEWITMNTSLRLFWGLPGMKNVIKDFNDTANYLGYYGEKEYKGIKGFKDYIMNSVSKKLNAGLSFHLPDKFDLDLNVYNILGTDLSRYDTQKIDRNVINTIRKSQVYYTDQRDFYSTDQLTFGVTVTKTF